MSRFIASICSLTVRTVFRNPNALSEVLTPVPAGFSLVPRASGLAKMADLAEADRRRIVADLDGLSEAADMLIATVLPLSSAGKR